jgi:hypothetical protein
MDFRMHGATIKKKDVAKLPTRIIRFLVVNNARRNTKETKKRVSKEGVE